ncbi:MAG: hypothetical protein E7327_11610 [Clostridiales bacterium]|nr:hypothetical protein [Clostridiales bacterium]
MKKLIAILSMLFAVPALAEETAQAAASATTMSLMTKGLIVTAGGLGGVFLVLILFFLMIRIMHKFLK